MQIRDILFEIERFAPLTYQEGYDNCGVQVGDVNNNATGAILSLDVTEAVVDEAIAVGFNLIIAHHPVIFSGLKSLTGKNYVERVILKAIKNDITIYAAHTNLDNVQMGVNKRIADKLLLKQTHILAPVSHKLYKLFTYVPAANAAALQQALFQVGLGQIGAYSECSFGTIGTGTFKASENANPTIGHAGGAREEVTEIKLEVLVPEHLKSVAISSLKENHPYEEVAYELIAIENENQTIGAGMIGELEQPMNVGDFLRYLKEKMQTACIRHTVPHTKIIQKVAVCGGAGSFLLKQAIAAKADIFITGDYKYHQFFDAENRIIIADIGHYESEQFTIEIFSELLKEKFPNFATLFTKTNTNPVNYYF
ncbi:Nif3-like dinuclear metal center hexameric protein [Taibaiella lutea]|uniref:GTP cyclohydrolase 1 type 2 homolog n=1 Tax=Taibaiella lutea TaxID=2608001 RepID=A0A5M6CN53_9BACT|nr:Nif3-like dinuclear metal center hexameric protein [Taibaiella lutea]KAA5536574.1 Nif3-like dinuclear metal center hexameric protein [Taibaiella lutea]